MIKKLTLWLGITLSSLYLLVGLAGPVLAAEYSCGAYGAGTYQNNVCGASTSTGSSGGGTGSTLENTGQKILPFVIPVVLILAGTILLFWTRKKPRKDNLPPPPDQPQLYQ